MRKKHYSYTCWEKTEISGKTLMLPGRVLKGKQSAFQSVRLESSVMPCKSLRVWQTYCCRIALRGWAQNTREVFTEHECRIGSKKKRKKMFTWILLYRSALLLHGNT